MQKGPVRGRHPVALLIAVVAFAGCTVRTGRVPASERDKRRLYHLRHTAIVDGHTTLADVTAQLGEPDYADADAHRVGYLWEFAQSYSAGPGVGWGMFAVGPKDTYDVRRHFLVLQLDEQGVVRWHRRSHYDSSDGPLPTLGEAVSRGPDERRRHPAAPGDP